MHADDLGSGGSRSGSHLWFWNYGFRGRTMGTQMDHHRYEASAPGTGPATAAGIHLPLLRAARGGARSRQRVRLSTKAEFAGRRDWWPCPSRDSWEYYERRAAP